MGHKGDIEETYTKREGKVDEGREQYAKCLKYLETEQKGISDQDKESLEKTLTGTVLKKVFGFSDDEIEDLIKLDDEELQKKIKEKKGMILNNGHTQKVIPMKEIEHYIEDLGWEYVKDLGAKAIVKLPEH